MADICNTNSLGNVAQQQCLSVVDRYQRLEVINAGSYGIVYRGFDKMTGEMVAMKHEVYGLSEESVREITILESLPPHPSIVGFKAAFVDERRRVMVVTEYMESDLNKSIHAATRPFTLSEVKLVMKRILEGVEFLHEMGVMHRDLKPANILMNKYKGEVKICDFGLSRLGGPSGAYTPGTVTQWYRAPEILLGQEYSSAVDMWSVGCIMAELMLGEVLFPGKSEIDQFNYIRQAVGGSGYFLKLRLAAATSFSGAPILTAAGMDMLRRLLAFDPNDRITPTEALNHIWFKEFYGLVSDD